MSPRQEVNVVLAVVCAGFLVMLSIGALIGEKVGYRQGYNKGQNEEAAKSIARQVAIANGCQNDVTDAFNRGVESAKYECDQMIALDERVCTASLQASFNRGQKDAMKRVGKACGIKLKFKGEK